MKNQIKEINELDLLRYVNNELSDRERTEVEEWIGRSEENRKIAEDYYYLSFAVSSLQSIQNAAPQKALEKVNKRIRKNRSQRLTLYFQRIAAMLLLPLLLLSAYLLLKPQEQEPIYYLEARMTPGMIGSTILPDGTKVWLNSSSYIKYPNLFSGDTREIELDGEAYFVVTENAEKPFIVHTENSSIKVLGTEFNVDAYSHNSFVATTLVKGAVEFNYKKEDCKTNSIFMHPNEQILYDKSTHQARLNDTYILKDIAWMKGKIILRETPLSEILWILSKRFNVEFTIKDPAFYKHSFTGVFTNQQIERVLEHFKRSSGINYQIDHQLDKDGEITKSRVVLY